LKTYAVLRGNRVIAINGDHEHLANANTIARAESRAHPKAEVCVVRLVTAYRNGIETITHRRFYYRERKNEK